MLEPGERVPFVLTWFPSHEPLPDPIDAEAALDDTEAYWLEWAGNCSHTGDYHDEIHSSLLVLKALTYRPTGGIVAAPTTSLPEHIGGERNWDYRFCWLRDATLTLRAMLAGGYRDEALAWRDWLLRAVAGDPADLQIMYGIAGERRLDERELDWLPGYERLAAGARRQRRLRASSSSTCTARCSTPPTRRSRTACRPTSRLVAAAKAARAGWRTAGGRRTPASGRCAGRTRHFTHSKVMAWVAFDRAVRSHEEFGREARSIAGERSGTRSTPRCSSAAWSDEQAGVRAVATTPTSSTRASC